MVHFICGLELIMEKNLLRHFSKKKILFHFREYLAVSRNGKNPAKNYVRIALVHNKKLIKEALDRIADVL